MCSSAGVNAGIGAVRTGFLGGHASVSTTAGQASFAAGGEAACVNECASLAGGGGALGPTQEQQLGKALEGAKAAGLPAIVVGDAALGFTLPDEGNYWKSAYRNEKPREASDSATVSALLVHGPPECHCGASAYIFDYPGVNVQTFVRSGGKVKVIVLDCSTLEKEQLQWLETQFVHAKSAAIPARGR